MSQPLSRNTIGILGPLGALVLIVWAVGFLVFGVHGKGWHVLFPIGVVLVLVQVILRLNTRTNESD